MFTLAYTINNSPSEPDYDPNYQYFIFDVDINEEYCRPNDQSPLYFLRQKYKIFDMLIYGDELTIDYGANVQFTTEEDIFAGIPYYQDYGTYRITAKAKRFTRIGLGPSSLSFVPITNIIKWPTEIEDCSSMFDKARYLTSLPEGYKIPNASSYVAMFNDCVNLSADITNIWPDKIKATHQDSFRNMFKNCENITGTAPADKLWNNTSLQESDSNGMATFYGCEKLSNYDQIPSKWKEWEV